MASEYLPLNALTSRWLFMDTICRLDIICNPDYTLSITVCTDGKNWKKFGDDLPLEAGDFSYHDIYHVLFEHWCGYSMVYEWLVNGESRPDVPFLAEEAVVMNHVRLKNPMPMCQNFELWSLDRPKNHKCTFSTFERAMNWGLKANHMIRDCCSTHQRAHVYITRQAVVVTHIPG